MLEIWEGGEEEHETSELGLLGWERAGGIGRAYIASWWRGLCLGGGRVAFDEALEFHSLAGLA